MIRVFNNGFRILIAEDDMILINKKTSIGSYFIFLGIYDSEENYEEITKEKYDEILERKKELEELEESENPEENEE